MAFERKVNECGLFPNTVHPDKSDFNAQIDVQCEHCGKTTGYWLNGWRKITRTGGKYISLALRAKSASAVRTSKDSRPAVAPAASDDIPW